MGDIDRERIDQDVVMQALADFTRVFAELPPYKQKDLIRLVLHKAILGPVYVKNGPIWATARGRAPCMPEPRSQTCNWLLGQVSQGVVAWDRVATRAHSHQVNVSAPPAS